jgi:hypothetical protein
LRSVTRFQYVDERGWDVIKSIQVFLDEAIDEVRQRGDESGPWLIDELTSHLGTDASKLPVTRMEVPGHQFVNLDIAMQALVEQHGGGSVLGVGGGDRRHHSSFGDLLQRNWRVPIGSVDRDRVDTGPDSSRDAVTFGIHLFSYDGVPVAALQKRRKEQYDGANGLEILAADDVVEALLADLRRMMLEKSVFRGQVLSFGNADPMYHRGSGGIVFLPRPAISAHDLVLPEGAAHRIERHVAGPARHRERLRAAGQHLKRGLLLYGPPGTGKTHSVRYLLSQLPDVTAVVLAGNSLGLISEATELAQALEPAIVVMEDIDLIAEHREYHGPQPLLYTLLDAMDGLNAEADVAFVLTTNRADLLEEALSQRPGRVDLALEVPLPDAAARSKLLRLYAGSLGLSDEAIESAAKRTNCVTASFFKELARRAVLVSADTSREMSDALFGEVLDEMLGDSEALTRSLLGSTGPGSGGMGSRGRSAGPSGFGTI